MSFLVSVPWLLLDATASCLAIRDDPDCPLTRSGGSPIEVDDAERDHHDVPETRSYVFYRRRSNRMVAGVAGGLADTLGVGDTFVRAAFVTLSMVWGLGVLLYLGFWLVAIDRVEDVESEPVSGHQAIGLAIAFTGLMLLFLMLGWWPSNGLVITVWGITFGTAFLTDRHLPNPLASLIDPTVESPGRFRMLIGVALLIGGLVVFASNIGTLFDANDVIIAIALTGLGLMVAFGPWITRLAGDLSQERRERIRQEERAEMAAHLHDSVLQTLALIQRSDDPARMSMLARHQEGELRDWLYGNAPLEGVDQLSTALRQAAARIEEDHQVPVEVVVVGDYPLDGDTGALVGAASEAMTNAAKHSGAERISLYFEAAEDRLEVYVTDQGRGFDTDDAGSGRGLADSIVGRMERAGGSATIDSVPGEGTEVILQLEVS